MNPERWTVADVAEILATSKVGNNCDEERQRVLWLIDQIPEMKEMWRQMTEEPGDRPSLMALATLVFASGSDAGFPETEETARWLLARAPGCAPLLARLDELRQDASIDHDASWWALAAVGRQEELTRLTEALASGERWTDPYDVLDCRHNWGVEALELRDLCRAWWERAEGAEKRELERVKRRLERYVEWVGLREAGGKPLEGEEDGS
jgi:hypothetical protein